MPSFCNDPREAGGVNGKANGRSISPASPIRAVLHIYGRFSEKSRTEKKAFLASLIGFPIVVGILSGALFLVTTADYDSRGVERVEDVELDGRTHEVYEFRMPGRFENDFPVEKTWNIEIDDDRRFYSDSDYGFAIDEAGTTWDFYRQDGNVDEEYYIQAEDNILRLALRNPADEPKMISYSFVPENVFLGMEWVPYAVWPLCTVAAFMWGKANNRNEFKQGAVISGGIISFPNVFMLFEMFDEVLGQVINRIL